MALYIVNFYDHNESGNVEHNELYSTREAAQNRFEELRDHLNGYSWVYLYDTFIKDGRFWLDDCLEECRSCYGDDDYYHGDDSDF